MLAPAVCHANAGLTARAKAIYINGLDVVRMGGGAGVDVDSVQLTWAGPGQVSGLRFTLKDPGKTLAPRQGDYVRFHDTTNDLALFGGWIMDVGYRTLSIGRQYEIACVGHEAVLDWMYVPSLAIPSSMTIADMARHLVASATGVGVSLNMASGGIGGTGSRVATPIAAYHDIIGFTAMTTPAGSLRRALEYMVNRSIADNANDVSFARLSTTSVSVDRWLGLRIWARYGPEMDVTGFTGIDAASNGGDHSTIAVSTAGPVRPSGPSMGYSGLDTPRGVYVKGANAAASLFIGDGTGLPGRIASISDPATTAAQAIAAGLAYLGRQGILLTGSFVIEGTQTMGSVAGLSLIDGLSRVTYTDSVLGVTAVDSWITSLRITFAPSGEQRWAVSIGSTLATAAAYMRSLTQDQLI